VKVLCVVPVHDRTEFINEALLSLVRQTRTIDEVVVTGNLLPSEIDVDLLACVARRSVHEINGHLLHDRLNSVIGRSDCEAYFVLADDDRVKPNFVERTATAIESADIAFTNYAHFGDDDTVIEAGPWSSIDSANTLPVTALVRKSVWEKVRGYQPVVYFDWDFWWRCWVAGASAYHIAEPLFEYRRHAGQTGSTMPLDKAELLVQRYRERLRSTGKMTGDPAIYDEVVSAA